jgi:cytochrome c biogenesis protein CcmG/thiol:disulfide interchange protein DsbE
VRARRWGTMTRVSMVAGVGLLGLVAATRLSPAGGPPHYRATGDPLAAPASQLEPVSGSEFDGILVGLRGEPVVVNVWASWCAPCRTEMPLLERAAQRFRGRVRFVGVASRDSRDEAAKFLDDVDVTYPNVFDASGAVRSRLELRGFPTTYVFDATGTLVRSIVGGVSEQQLAAQLEELAR